MRPLRPVSAIVLSFVVILSPVIAKQTTSSIQPSMLLKQSLAAQLGNTQISNVTLTGSARRIAGSDDESGAVTLKVLSSGSTRVDLNLPSGIRTEFKSLESQSPSGAWSGPDGVFHKIAYHNLINDWGWAPLFALATCSNPQNFVVSFVGTETRNDQSVIHLTSIQKFPDLSAEAGALMRHLSQLDIFLNPATLLPTSIAYNIHPDDNALLDIPVEIQFSDYRTVNGAQIPFHIQKFINKSLALDLQFQSAALNTGLTAAQVGAQ